MTARSLALALVLTAVMPSAHAPAPDALHGRTLAVVEIHGTITDALNGAVLAGAQVSVPGTNVGGLSAADGTYRLLLAAAWAGHSVEVGVQLVGYTTARHSVTLGSGSNRVDVRLSPNAIALDEIVVTGVPAEVRRRSLGNAVFSLQVAGAAPAMPVTAGPPPADWNREQYARIEENGFRPTSSAPLSTFSIDVDRASYANVRRFVRGGMRPPEDAVRVEELINYFPYADAGPDDDVPFAVHTEVGPAPWQPAHRLVRIALKARDVEVADLPPANLVFLLDVSGSMQSPDKLPLVKQALHMLVERLRPQDRVAVVVYAGAAGLALPSTPGSDKETILAAIDQLEAGGSTAGGAGIELAYRVARENHVDGGTNRVILATDGDFNVGASSDGAMVRLIEEKREQGTFLTVLGFGTGNLQDAKMEQIADHGNGSYAYIDSRLEARKALVHEMGGTLLTVAKDVKIQVEFNPERVAAYRLIGYENRLLADEDFVDDTKDAGELGAGHSVVALYEVVPVGVESPVTVAGTPLRYQENRSVGGEAAASELLFVKLRYKEPTGTESRLLTTPVVDRDGPDGEAHRDVAATSADFRFAAAVASWGMLLRGSEHCGDLTLADVHGLAAGALGADPGGYRAEFLGLVDAADRGGILTAAR